MILINNIQSEILELLGRFSYLAVSQFQFLTGKSLGYLREQLAILSHRGFIKSYHVEITAKVRAENIYFLTVAGKEVLLTNEKAFADDIRLPVGLPMIIRDYHHRKAFIDLHIALYLYCKKESIELVTFLTYFDKVGNVRKNNNLEAKTKISLGGDMVFIPDGIMITEQNNSKTLYLLELYADKNTIRILEQLAKHAKAISLGTASKKFDMTVNPFVLSVFEHESIKEAVIKRLKQNDRFTNLSKLFFFATLADVQGNCDTAFHTITNEQLKFT